MRHSNTTRAETQNTHLEEWHSNTTQATPTHTSAFHLFTVAMTGHAEDKGVQLPQHVTVESV